MRKITFNGKKNIIGKRLREIRESSGLTQRQLVARMQVLNVNMDQQIVSRIEKQERMVTDYELACFCMVLKIDAAALLRESYEEISAK